PTTTRSRCSWASPPGPCGDSSTGGSSCCGARSNRRFRMSHADHEWAKEHLTAHLAGGLAAEERARLEAHAGSCAECIAELAAARRFDRQMDDLFAPVRARAGMEERI